MLTNYHTYWMLTNYRITQIQEIFSTEKARLEIKVCKQELYFQKHCNYVVQTTI